MLTFVCVSLVSCGNDDEDDKDNKGNNNSNNSSINITSKRIAKISSSDGYDIKYEYDSQGRVVKKIYYYQSKGVTYTYSYSYVDNKIISKVVTLRNDSIVWSGDYTTYFLSNGVVVKTIYYDNEYDFSYDIDGYLKSEIGEHRKRQFAWSDGYMFQISGDITIVYSDIPWPKNWIQDWPFGVVEESSLNGDFMPLGAWGKMPKYLPSKYYVGPGRRVYTMDYVVENGEITHVIKFEESDYDVEILSIEWE